MMSKIMFGAAMSPESITNISKMLTDSYIQFPCGTAHILQAKWALKKIKNTFSRTSNTCIANCLEVTLVEKDAVQAVLRFPQSLPFLRG